EHRVGAGLRPGGNLVRIGNVLAGAGRIELPAMERADEVIALDLAAEAEVRAEVRAERVERSGLTIVTAEQHDVAAEVVHGLHFADGELVRIAELVPAVGD